MLDPVHSYRQVKALKPEGLRARVRRYALDGLSAIDRLRGSERYLTTPRVQFLYIHHVFKDEEAALDRLLQRLSVNHTFIPYSEGVRMVLHGVIDKPYICISSDDGFKNNMQAARILNAYNAKACFFINPALMVDRTAQAVAEHCRIRLNFPPVEFMDWDDVHQLLAMGHEIGSHTMEHINVAATEKQIFEEDCRRTYEILTQQCGAVRHFAFPYGRFFHFNESGRKAVFDAGFLSCASAERGCHIGRESSLPQDQLCIRRDHVVLDWDLEHVMYFLARNARNASVVNDRYPYPAL